MKEFVITLENRPGSMAECCEAIGNAGINILGGAGIGGSVSTAVIVTEDESGTSAALDSAGVSFTTRDLNTVVLEDYPGSLGVFMRSLAENNINLGSIHIMKTDEKGVHIGYSTD